MSMSISDIKAWKTIEIFVRCARRKEQRVCRSKLFVLFYKVRKGSTGTNRNGCRMLPLI